MRAIPPVALVVALSAALAAGWGAPCAAEQVQVVREGRAVGPVEAYRVGDAFHLDAKDLCRLYSCGLQWFPVRGQVRLSLRGRPVLFEADSAEVLVGTASVTMPGPMLVRAGKAFVPIEFLSVPGFASLAGVSTRFEPSTRVLSISARASVGPLRWFSHPDRTRIVLELDEGLKPVNSRRGTRGLELSIPNGSVDAPRSVRPSDGVVESVELSQDGKSARLEVALGQWGGEWTLSRYDAPRRIVIDVMRTDRLARERALREAAQGVPEAPADEIPSRAVEPPAAATERVPQAAEAPREALPVSVGREAEARRPLIVIDAGHGGKDSGALSRRGTLEKTVNLQVARELARILKDKTGLRVMLTREGDSFVPLDGRSTKANEAGADLFVSLHCNAHPRKSETGYEIYFLSERASDPEAQRLAEFENSVLALEDGAAADEAAGLLYALARTEFINDAAELSGLLSRSLSRRVDLENRGVKQASFYVLRGANAPAVLVEMAFLSNPKDEERLRSEKYRRRIVEGLVGGLVEYARRKGWETGGGR